MLDDFRSGARAPQAIAYFQARTGSAPSRQLNLVELARLEMLDGRFEESRGHFAQAIEEVLDFEEGAVVRLSHIASKGLAGTLLTETAVPYVLPGYELVMALHAQALNHLFLGDPEAAGVEIRRAIYAQDLLAEEHAKLVEKQREKVNEQKQSGAMAKVSEAYVQMAPVLGRVKDSFQNPYTWYFSALMLELEQDSGNAFVAYKKAWELMPQNRHLQRDVLRLAAGQNPQEHSEFKARFGHDSQTAGDGNAEIIVFLEENFISRRQSIKIPIPIGNLWQSILFPAYADGPYQPLSVTASIDGGVPVSLDPLCYLQSQAYFDLKEKIPGMVLRNVTRAVARAAAQKALIDDDHAGAKLAGLVWNVATFAAEQADTRAWYSLPMVVQLARFRAPHGKHTLSLLNTSSGRRMEFDLDLNPDEKKLVWVADMRGRASVCLATLNGEPASSIFLKVASLIGGSADVIMGATGTTVAEAEKAF